MIEKLFADHWEDILVGVLVGIAYFLFTCWQGERIAFIEYKVEVSQIAKAKVQENERIKAEHEANLKQLRGDYEAKVPAIRSAAVAAYLARRVQPVSGTGSSGVPVSGSGIRMDDASIRECVPDTALIQNSAEDAAKLGAWQQYGKLNHLPIEE